MADFPAFQFYPGDWRASKTLGLCSLAAKGAWIDLLCIMHDCEPRGQLVLNGSPVTDKEAVKYIGGDRAAKKALAELIDRGVLVRIDGVLSSPRMMKDEAIRQQKKRAGSQGGKAKGKHK